MTAPSIGRGVGREFDLAGALVRAWTHTYTLAMPAERQLARRREISSDVFEHRAEAEAAGRGRFGTGAEVAWRLVRGMPADIAWRMQRGGFEMNPMIGVERTAGVAIFLVAIFGVLSVVLGPGIAGDDPYFSDDFPAFTRELDAFRAQLIFKFAFVLAMPAVATLLYLTFRPHVGTRVALGGAAALVLSALPMLIAAIAGVRLHTLGGVWSESGSRGDSVWLSAKDAAQTVELGTALAAMIFSFSFVVLGVYIARRAMLPRPLGGASVVGAAILVAGAILSIWVVMMVGIALVVLSVLTTAAWLAIRGTR
jgi:lipid-A-disaccharide synthase-like uncharacterized protein